MKKKLFTSIAATLITTFVVCSAGTAAPIEIKFSHITAGDSVKGKAAEYFKKHAEERTKGAVHVSVYANSTLYKDKEELEALQLGAVQMLAPSQSKFGPLGVRDFEVLDMPYLFSNLDEEHRVTQGAIGKNMLAKLRPKGILGLAFWDNGFKQISSNTLLRIPADLKGKKIRIASSKIVESQYRILGGMPQVMAFSELYGALQTGVVDGQENPTGVIFTSKLHEVQKYLSLTNHAYHGNVLVANAKFWQGLPAGIRTVLEDVIKDTTVYFHEASKKDNADSLEQIRKSGRTQIITLTDEEKKAWRSAFVKTHPEAVSRVGRPLIETIYKETGFNPADL